MFVSSILPGERNLGIFDIIAWLKGMSPRGGIGPPASAMLKALRAGRRMKYFYTYVIKSKRDNNIYIGWTDDVRLRIKKHNSGKVKSTKDRTPFVLVYFEGCLSKANAIKREKQLKTGFGRKYLKTRM